ncbi:hypothetical protein H7T43_10985 [Peribacillus simplex]|uniref:hypothetical protein n=1 Tax=Peribacillus TaxID=2675229 RepID=UPI002162308D|nr:MULTISPECIES: hypothetical protein [Peribacillus]MBX9955435.1 hypothetical protein [Peribacillus simplex]
MKKIISIVTLIVLYWIVLLTYSDNLEYDSIFYLASSLFILSLIFIWFLKIKEKINIFILIALLNISAIYLTVNFLIGIILFLAFIVILCFSIYSYISK